MPRQQIAQDERVQAQPHGRRLQMRDTDSPAGPADDRCGTADDAGRVLYVSDRPLQFEVIPQVCLVADVCHFLRLSERQFHYLMARGELALAELEPYDRLRRFTGESVAFEIKRRSKRRIQ